MDDIKNPSPAESQEASVISDIDEPTLTGDEYQVAHGERLSQTLDLGTWQKGTDLVSMYERLGREVAVAVEQEKEYTKLIREKIFPKLRTRPAPRLAPAFTRSSRDAWRKYTDSCSLMAPLKHVMARLSATTRFQ